MQINAVCPVCQTNYQLPETMRGQAIRCPNSLCRNIFTVGAAPAQPPPVPAPRPEPPKPRPSPKQTHSGSVGDLVPILRAEEVAPARSPAPPRPAVPVMPAPVEVPELLPLDDLEVVAEEVPEVLEVVEEVPLELDPVKELPKKKKPAPKQPKAASSWQDAPPVRRPSSPSPVVSAPAVEAVAAADEPAVEMLDEPRAVAAGAWHEPPPVRQGDGADQPVASTDPLSPGHSHSTYDPYPVAHTKKRLGLAALVGLMIFVCAVGVGGILVYRMVFAQTEAQLASESMEEYNQGNFSQAASHFKQLQEKFPGSARKDEYAYMEQLSGLRGRLGAPQLNPEEGLADLEHFVEEHKDDETFRPQGAGLAKSAAKLVTDYPNAVPMDEKTPEKLDRAEKFVANLGTLLDDNGFTKEDLEQVGKAIADARGRHGQWLETGAVLAHLRLLPGPKPWADAIQEANRLLRLKKREQNPEARRELERLFAGHFASVQYTATDEGLKAVPPTEEHSSIWIVAPVKRAVDAVDDGNVLALARGVLYGLRRSGGQMRWARRVGIDTATLPVRVPPKAPYPEAILVVSADTQTLTALNDDGKELWEYRLGKPSRGRPLIVEREVDRLAYVPTYDGQIHVIELAQGKLVGRYDLKHKLTNGGVRQPGTDLVYFPADDDCVYVINVREQRLVQILYTGHPAGSLRGEPLIVASDAGALARGEAYLVLNQTQGLDAMRLRLFGLPLADRYGPEAVVNPPPRVRGWTWFPPTYDGEKVVLLSDAGLLGLFGVQQPGTRDPLLYPRLGVGGVGLDNFLGPEGKAQGRAQVVQVQGNDFWVLALGKLQHLQIAWGAEGGPRLVAAWPGPLALGSPLHSSQVVTDSRADRTRTTLFLVTQSLTDPSCLATAVDDETSAILWQRQLGLICRTPPLPLRLPGGMGDPVLLVMDQSGGLFAFDPAQTKYIPGERGVRVADAVEDNPEAPAVLIPAADGQSAYEVACPGNGRSLLVRHVQLGADRQVKVLVDKRFDDLSAPLLGTPALAANLLVVPLADGSLARVALDKWTLTNGDPWRAEQAAPDTRGHALALAPERFLVTNGARGFKVLQKNAKGNWATVPEETDGAGDVLENRVTTAPVLLSAERAEVCAADAGGGLSVLAVQPNGQLHLLRKWDLGGKITAGPFLRTMADGLRIGCVVDQRRLAWIDPTADKALWTTPPFAKPIQGQPQLVEGVLVVADQSGKFVGLDPATGTEVGPGYALHGSVAPTTSPAGFDANRLFVPLSDGTILLVPTNYFRKP